MPNATVGHSVGLDIASTLEAAGIIGLWTYDLARGLVCTDRAMAITYGVDPERAARGVPPEDFRKAIHPEDRAAAQRALEAAIRDCTEYLTRYRVIDDEGAATWIEARGRPVVHGGKAVRMTGANFIVIGSPVGRTARRFGAQIRLAVADSARDDRIADLASLSLISGRQIHAARTLLGWPVVQLAETAGIPPSAIIRLERNRGFTPAARDILRQLKAALERAGVTFTRHDGARLNP